MILPAQYGSLRCLVSVPLGHSTNTKLWPVLCFLHGFREAAPLDIEVALTRHGPLNPASAPEATDSFVVVAPQLPPPGGKIWGAHEGEVKQVLDGAAQAYRGDPARLYLKGFSYVGDGVLDLDTRLISVWAGLWAVYPTSVPQLSAGRPTWLSAGEYARQQKQTLVDRLGVHEVRGDSTGDYVYRDPGLNHVETATQAYADSAIYKWLLARLLR